MPEFYDPSEHGPFDELPLDRRYCMLRGGYVLCPGLDDDLRCSQFDEELLRVKTVMFGLHGQRQPVKVPLRCKKCLKANLGISIKVGGEPG